MLKLLVCLLFATAFAQETGEITLEADGSNCIHTIKIKTATAYAAGEGVVIALVATSSVNGGVTQGMKGFAAKGTWEASATELSDTSISAIEVGATPNVVAEDATLDEDIEIKETSADSTSFEYSFSVTVKGTMLDYWWRFSTDEKATLLIVPPGTAAGSATWVQDVSVFTEATLDSPLDFSGCGETSIARPVAFSSMLTGLLVSSNWI